MAHFTQIWRPPPPPPPPENGSTNFQTVTFETGATLESLMSFLESENLTLASIPVMGQMTMGGVLATGSHGTGLPSSNPVEGLTFGSVSNAIVEMEMVTWNETMGQFQLEKFHRSNPKISPLLVSLGQILITQVELRVGANYNLRCLSRMNIRVDDLFAHPMKAGRNSLGALASTFGSVGSIWFPFTTFPWLRIWSMQKQKLTSSRHVTKPYNYPFSENFPDDVATILSQIQKGNSRLTPLFSRASASAIRAGLTSFGSWDIWGKSKNLILSTKSSTLQVSVNGMAVLTGRENLQNVLHQIYSIYQTHLHEFANRGKYPVNGPLEIRISAMDQPEDVGIEEAQIPFFATSGPTPNQNFDTIVWTDITTFSKTNYVSQFMSKIEDDFATIFDGRYALVRSEWSKRWGYSVEGGAWTNASRFQRIPKLYPRWDDGVEILKEFDPYGVFQNQILDQISD